MTDDIDWEDAFERCHPALLGPPPSPENWRVAIELGAGIRRLARSFALQQRAGPWRPHGSRSKVLTRGAP
jgi:hypothetical protein